MNVHTCVRGKGGDCFYIASNHVGNDYGRLVGRRFFAFVENQSEVLELFGCLEVVVSQLTLLTQGIPKYGNDFSRFIIEHGLAKIGHKLRSGVESGFQDRIEFHRGDPPEKFEVPSTANPIEEQKKLRNEILVVLARLHSAGQKRISKQTLLLDLCSDINWIDQQLNLLRAQKFLDVASPDLLKLTSQGHLAAEDALSSLGVSARTSNTVFYSWQSDAPNNVCRGLIQRALEDALADLSEHYDLDPRPDRDTLGAVGSPSIAETILSKIDRCAVFVADLSFVGTGDFERPDGPRKIPNPNVLIEYGYAWKKLGETAVIGVLNTAYGSVSQPPFDLRHRKSAIEYRAVIGDDEGSQQRRRIERHRLSQVLKEAVQASLDAERVSSD